MKSGESVVAAGRYWGRLRFFVKPDKDAVVLDDGHKEREVMVPRALDLPLAPETGQPGLGRGIDLGEVDGPLDPASAVASNSSFEFYTV